MKLTIVACLGFLSASEEKKVPPRHPLQRLRRLNQFAQEWLEDNLPKQVSEHWKPKFDRNTSRFERRFQICPFYKPGHGQHGGIVRRDATQERHATVDFRSLA